MDGKRIGFELVAARRRAGLTQRAVADRMGTTQSAVCRVESGGVEPTFALVERYARAVGERITVTFGQPERDLPPREERARRVRRVLGDKVVDPWERDPTPAEQRVLESVGLTREYFRRAKAARRS